MGLFSFFSKNKNNDDTFEINYNDELFLKLRSKSTKDKLQNLIIYTSCLASEPLRDKSKHYDDKLNTILSVKKNASSSQESYVSTLIKNIIYISNINYSLKENFSYFLSKDTILSEIQYNNLVSKLEEQYKISSYKYTENDINIENTYRKQEDISLLIYELEADYKYNITYFEILNSTLLSLINHEESSCLLSRNSKDVISQIDYYIRNNSSYTLSLKNQ